MKEIFDADEHARQEYYNETLIEDDCHPSARGHRLIAESLYPLFKD